MKRFLLLLVSCVLCSYVFAQNNVIETELQEVMNQKGDEMIDVSIMFKSQIDAAQLKAKAGRSDDKAMKREIVVSELKDFSSRQQSDVMEILKAEEASGNVADIEALWIVNVISCKANRDVIYKLASHPDVAALSYDKEIQLLSDEQMAETTAMEARRGNPAAHVVTINADHVWEQGYTGKNVVVAVLDTGVNREHKDIKDNLWEGLVDTDGDGILDKVVNGWNTILDNENILDDNGHGTHCAGIVCGNGTSGISTGVAPDARLMTVKVAGAGATGSVVNMLNGVEFAVANGADILSISLGFNNSQLTVAQKELIRKTFNNVLTSSVIACAAVGNDGNNYGAPNNVDYPAACPSPWINPDQTLEGGLSSVIAVGANDLGTSSQGPSTWEGTSYNDYPYNNGESMGLIRPDITAPGKTVYSLNHTQNDAYKMMEGSSQSTPAVAGVIALMLEKNSSLTPAQIAEIIETTAADKPENGKNNVVGAGRVDALEAITNTAEGDKFPYLQLVSFSPENIAHGDDIEISFTVKNEGKGVSSQNATATVYLSNDQYVSMATETLSIGELNYGDTKELSFTINVDEQVPNGHISNFVMLINDDVYTWKENFFVKVDATPNIVYKSCTPGIIKPEDGEVSLNVTMVNNGTVASLNDTKITLSAISNSLNHITIVNDETTIGALGVNETATATFTIKANEDAADNYSTDLFLETFSESTTTSDYIYEFENGLEGWTSFDAANNDIDNPWWHSSKTFAHGKTYNGSHSGNGHVMSETMITSGMHISYNNPLDNYLVSPNKAKITENSEISFYASANHITYYPEHFGVAISENGNSSVADFTTIEDWTIKVGKTWNKYTVDLSQYAGKEIYVAIRHFFTEEEWTELDEGYLVEALNIDDIVLSNVMIDQHHVPSYSDTDVNYFNVVISNPIDLDLEAPTGLALSNITTESITLSWEALEEAQSYNVYCNEEMIANITAKSVEDGETIYHTTYTHIGLTHNTEYCYTVAGVHNGNVHEQCEEVCGKTLQKDYNTAIKSFTPEVIYIDGNTTTSLDITFVNDGKLGHESRSSITLSSNDEYVTITTATASMSALDPNEEIDKSFNITVSENVPNNHVIRINANVKYLNGDTDTSWDLPLDILVKNDPAAPKGLTATSTYNSVTLQWNAVENAISYNIYRDNEAIASTASTTYYDGGLNASTEYRYYGGFYLLLIFLHRWAEPIFPRQ